MQTPAAMWQRNPPEQLLKERFHINTGFHPDQRDIIEQLVMGKRLLVIQRTGWGKSLCYQMASLYYPHLTLVFSPLKALMRDQCQRCNDSYGIAAGMVSSEFSTEENRATLARAVEGKLHILFIAPERLDNADWQSSVSQMPISMIVIDEAHCISTWGHDFRPHYQRIVRLLSALPSTVPVLGLTATANMRVEQDVLGQIGAGTQVIRGTMWRPNLYLNVVELRGDREKLAYLAEFLPRLPGTGIIYTATQHDAEMTAAFLQQQGMQAEYYHSRREEQVKRDIEQKFMANQYKVVCATNALGMGIDKPDIRFVIHYQIPASPIHYYQEIGRAGRDTKVSWCVLLYDMADLAIQEHFNRTAKPEAKCYDFVMSLLQVIPQGLRDLMQLTGYAQSVVEHVLFDLQEQHLIERNARDRTYVAVPSLGKVDFAAYDLVREQKKRELKDMQDYAQLRYCYMEYLTTYLGDAPGYACRTCGNCRSSNFPVIKYPERIQTAAARFLEEEYLPRIEKRGNERRPEHEVGWSLSYHGGTRIGGLVSASKYKDAGPFPLSLLNRAWVQKKENVKAAFSVNSPEQVVGRTFLLIDDIYEEKLVGQAFLVEQLAHNQIHMLTVLDADYPKLLKTSLKREQTPPVLFYAGNLSILARKTIAVIGSRNAGEESLEFTRAVSAYLAEKGTNVISGNARGVDRAAYEGATSIEGHTTVVLPHGIRKLSGMQMRALQPKIESGNVLLMSQFHPDAQWVVSRAMERNKVVTGLAQVVIVAESDVQGGTWEGANGALKQHRPLYVRKSDAALAGNNKLIELGGNALFWPVADVATMLSPILQESAELQQEKQEAEPRPDQLSLFATSNE